jgi:O-antigen/teichoic acid export membrane protein
MAVSSDPTALRSDPSGVAIRGGAIRVVGYTSGVLVALGTAAILVRHLGIVSFGRYVTVISLIALVGGVTEAGINVYGIREFDARSESDREQLMANLLTMRLILTAVGIACAACFALAVGYRQVLVLGTLVAGAGLLVQVTSDVLSIPLQSRLQLGRLTAAELTRRVLVLLLIGVLALVGASLLPLLAASTIAGAVTLALLAWLVRSSITIRLRFDREAWRELFSESLPFAVAMSIGAIYFYVTVIVMSLIASDKQTGLFATSFRVTQVAIAIPIILLTAIFPLMARTHTNQGPDAGAMVGKVFTVAVICGVWMSLAMVLGASFIIDVIAGSQGRGAVPVLRIQALALTLSFISTASALNLISLRRYRLMIIASSSALAFDIALALALVPTLGARGGALADVITEVLMAIGLTGALMRSVPQHQIKASVVWPVLVASALSATVLLLPIGSIGHVIGATIIYFGLLLLMGVIPDDVIAAMRRLPAMGKPS